MATPADRSKDPKRQAAPRLMTGAEVAATFNVHPKTVTRWAQAGHISHFKTPGGHRRFNADDVEKMMGPNNG
jgi:excisionase family DNA binding protein